MVFSLAEVRLMDERGKKNAALADFNSNDGDLGGNRTEGPTPHKKTPTGGVQFSGDLGGSRTRVDGMKTRCTNRYTTRPSF